MGTLERPDGVGDGEWESITEAEDRLHRARAASDGALVVGSAKELCEAVAKVVVAERGGLPGGGKDMPDLITTAHKVLAFQPGEALANDAEARKIAQGLISIVLAVSEMRNKHGTGHGRAAPSGMSDEHAQLSFGAALLWSGWALRRLEPYIEGDVTSLVRDLEGQTFRRGDLARRLLAADLVRLSVEDQSRLGVAVGRRASSGTFVVAEDGVEAVKPEGSDRWPVAYVEGLVVGLLFDANGFLHVGEWKIDECARLIGALPDPVAFLQPLAERVIAAASRRDWATDENVRRGVLKEFQESATLLPEGTPRDHWLEIARRLERSTGDPSK